MQNEIVSLSERRTGVRAPSTSSYARLARAPETLANHYDVIVVGSGYGGSIAAYHLAKAGHSVCLLERGKERLPGEYPTDERQFLKSARVEGALGEIGSDTALFDVRVGDSYNVVQGSGLGGGSQINAGVALEPSDEVLADPRWPEALRKKGALAPYFERARTMLGAAPLPEGSPTPAKMRAHALAAVRTDKRHERVPLTVRFESGRNAAGIHQPSCTHCGDCCSGCNTGAKTTTWMTYLTLAARHGAEIFTELRVQRISRHGEGWRVHLRPSAELRRAGCALPGEITARAVVVCAGALGSTEILLRSAEQGLRVSPALGTRFSGNGDMLAFAYATEPDVHAMGIGTRAAAEADRPGPCITGQIVCTGDGLDAPSLVQEGVIPAAGARVVTGVLRWLAAGAPSSGRARATDGERVHTLLLIGHDESSGELRLEDGRLRIRGPSRAFDAEVRRKVALLKRTAGALGGTFVDNPTASGSLGNALVTVHPLGGCPMADRAEDGVVNDRGQVFSSATARDVHPCLYVCDGAIIPRSLGANPLLTISALSERIAEGIVRDLSDDVPADPKGATPAVAAEPGLRFEETLRGTLHFEPGSDFARALGDVSASSALTLTGRVPSLRHFFAQATHRVSVIGALDIPNLACGPLSVHQGHIELFPSDDLPMRMVYDLRARDIDGASYRITGRKSFVDGPLRVLRDVTTLDVQVRREGDDALIAHGALRLGASDTARLLASIEVTNAADSEQRARLLARFVAFFTGTLRAHYRAELSLVEGPPPARMVVDRALSAPAPEEFDILAADGARLALTRYRGGTRGPVLLAPGFAMTADSFALPTVGENLVEHLTQRGFDVWLFDYRSSPKLEAAERPYDLDDIAVLDWPAAVQHILRVTKSRDLQVVAHCAGSMTLLMALLAGMRGVRSIVSSQLTLHPVSCLANRFKASLRLPSLLGSLGVRVLPAVAREGTDLDHFRIRALFGPTFHGAKVSALTRERLPRYFGSTCVHPFDHFSRIIRAGRVVDRRGNDAYLPHVGRLRMPIMFLAGAQNKLFLPETSRRTWASLRSANDPALYERAVLPDYAHLDCFIGDHAARDVYPMIFNHLERHAA